MDEPSGRQSPEPAPGGNRADPSRTRRWLLRVGLGLAGTGALAAGGVALYDRGRRFWREAERSIPDHRVDLPSSLPRMVVAHGTDAARNVRGALERLGGIGRFVTPSDVVLIKPNVGWERTPEQAANTQPEVVAALVRACREAGASRVIVSDCPVGRPRRCFERSGILRAAEDAGAEVVLADGSRYHTVRLSDRLGTWDVLEPYVIATKIINAPVVKHHNLSQMTGGMKNWIGITDRSRMSFHSDLDRSIAELAALMRPTLTVLDASRVLMRHGPEGGNPADVKPVNALAASVDPVATDAWASEVLGATSATLPRFLMLAEEMGLGRSDYRALGPVEITTG